MIHDERRLFSPLVQTAARADRIFFAEVLGRVRRLVDAISAALRLRLLR
jgi:hypothetical protein